MGIEGLTAALKDEAAKEEAALLAAAESRAAEIRAGAEARLADLDGEAARIEAKCRAIEDALRKGAEKTAARKRLAAAEQAYAHAVREECRALFRDFMQTPAYAGFAAAQYKAAAGELGTVERVAADARTAAALKGAVGDGTALETAPGIADGFAAYGTGGKVAVWCTFDTRFEKAWRRGGPAYARVIAEAAKHGI
ncbi:MAG: hypothetical protein EPO63_08635 [Candidatus Nitrosotenuis sp.]|nr:MAG: hypothetical protein EPO63_08635 [Candidatus Nitrosotenuis sp.]